MNRVLAGVTITPSYSSRLRPLIPTPFSAFTRSTFGSAAGEAGWDEAGRDTGADSSSSPPAKMPAFDSSGIGRSFGRAAGCGAGAAGAAATGAAGGSEPGGPGGAGGRLLAATGAAGGSHPKSTMPSSNTTGNTATGVSFLPPHIRSRTRQSAGQPEIPAFWRTRLRCIRHQAGSASSPPSLSARLRGSCCTAAASA